MKLKPLKPRLHNIMFHTHTVAGIVISVTLFIIFYAGAFSLFRDHLNPWENQNFRFKVKENINYDSIVNVVKTYDPKLKDVKDFTISPPWDNNPFLRFSILEETSDGKKKTKTYYINPHTGEYSLNLLNRRFADRYKSTTYMGETLYRLHYLRIFFSSFGIYISGIISFFFLFAIVTGVLVHWKSTIDKFYAFTTKGKWKQIFTNSHTTLGFVALPFQFVYALTGSLMGLLLLILAPSAYLIYNGDTNEIRKLVSTEERTIEYDENAKYLENTVSINEFFNEVHENYPNQRITSLKVNNFEKIDGDFTFNLTDEIGISNRKSSVFYTYKNGHFVSESDFVESTYTNSAYNILIKLHYANYGSFFLKIIYFILAMITCYIIISGVLIWQKARDNKKYTDKQRRFHHRVTKVYLSICLSMYPVFALIFIANKAIPLTIEGRVVWVHIIFFGGWLLLIILGLVWDNYAKINRNYLFIGSVLAVLIPIANGIVTNDWFWKTFINKQYHVFCVDFTWLLTGISGFVIYKSLLKKSSTTIHETNQNNY